MRPKSWAPANSNCSSPVLTATVLRLLQFTGLQRSLPCVNVGVSPSEDYRPDHALVKKSPNVLKCKRLEKNILHTGRGLMVCKAEGPSRPWTRTTYTMQRNREDSTGSAIARTREKRWMPESTAIRNNISRNFLVVSMTPHLVQITDRKSLVMQLLKDGQQDPHPHCSPKWPHWFPHTVKITSGYNNICCKN